jgi:hypothetical protein
MVYGVFMHYLFTVSNQERNNNVSLHSNVLPLFSPTVSTIGPTAKEDCRDKRTVLPIENTTSFTVGAGPR